MMEPDLGLSGTEKEMGTMGLALVLDGPGEEESDPDRGRLVPPARRFFSSREMKFRPIRV